MSPLPPKIRGMYFEEFEVGQKILTVGRTVTETDVVNFAGVSADFNEAHTNSEYGKATPFGQRVAHGLLGLSIASGLAWQTGILEGTIFAFRQIDGWKFVKPVLIGDTIHVEMEVVSTKAIPRLGGGSVMIELDVQNQNGETVMKGEWTTLILSTPEDSD
ncbi:MAG: MaoC/PaaZ C-terminal domain-containing protein [Anaerolineae bacterium]|nr:MaoC/PaaZ C-terminal domain-containing protein [Anaerolineae bacterium]